MYTSEIEKLEKRWAENPKGRNFAPLADAYRKAGELDRAIELCKSGLERHPDYVSAHIVYGRCFLDLKNDTTATQVFRKVLELDPENVLGLKLLAEIAERGGHFAEAAEWLTRLLAADPMNGEAQESLLRTKAKATQAGQAATASAAPAAAPAPAAPAAPAPAAGGRGGVTAPMPKPEFVVEHSSDKPVTPEIAGGRPAGAAPGGASGSDIETFDGTLDFNAVAHDAAKAEGLEVQEDVQLAPQPLVVEGLAATQFESGTFAAPAEPASERAVPPARGDADVQHELAQPPAPPAPPPPAPRAAHVAPPEPAAAAAPQESWPEPPLETDSGSDLPLVDLPLIMPDDVAPPRAASAGLVAPAWPPSPSPPPAPAPPPPVARARRTESAPPAAVVLSDDDGAADAVALSRAEPVVTETMAELYLKQGHQEDALRVYQALLAQRPGDARLRARVDALSPGGRRGGGRGTGESVPAFLRRILAGRPQTTPPSAPPPPAGASPLEHAFALAPRDSEAQPQDAGFAGPVGSASFGEADDAGATETGGALGDATRPAGEGDTISLDQVFGDEGARGSLPAASPPPEPAPAPPAAAQTGGFSFDQFFGATAAAPGGGRPAGGGAPPAAARPSGPRAHPPVEDEGDLDQFQAWLKGLKT